MIDFDNFFISRFVPCQPDQLSPRQLAERLEDAEPCHNYNNHGAGPLGCW